jgi:hypothetical protein
MYIGADEETSREEVTWDIQTHTAGNAEDVKMEIRFTWLRIRASGRLHVLQAVLSAFQG